MKYIKKEIDNPFIDPIYGKLGLDKFGRKQVDIDPTEFQNQDSSWIIFQRFFANFISYYSVSYLEYLDNRVIINKNPQKLQKALMSFYSNSIKKEQLLLDCPSIYWGMTDDNETFEKSLARCVSDLFRNRKTKKRTKLVLSLNYSDWLLCSTKEAWTSCLSLSKQESTEMYWCSIPTIFGDKNRALLYVTDEEITDCFGLKKERFLNRSWVLLDDKDNLNVVRNYPNSAYKNLNFKKLLGFENDIFLMDKENKTFQGKHELRPVITEFTRDEKFVLIPYLDGYTYYPYNNKILCRSGGAGTASFIKNSRGGWVNQRPYWNRTAGFQRLIENKVSLKSLYFKYRCSKCLDGIPESNRSRKKDIKNQAYCTTCYSLLFTCLECEKKTDRLYDNNKYCSICSHIKKEKGMIS